MALSEFQTEAVKVFMEEFLKTRRPPPEIRDRVDIAYRIEGQSVVVFSIRPMWNDFSRKIEIPVAKTTYVKTLGRWKVYWQRADLKWHGYKPHPEVLSFESFLRIVAEDEYSCFWG